MEEKIKITNNEGEHIHTIADEIINLLRVSEMTFDEIVEKTRVDEEHIEELLNILKKHNIIEEGVRTINNKYSSKKSFLEQLKGEIIG